VGPCISFAVHISQYSSVYMHVRVLTASRRHGALHAGPAYHTHLTVGCLCRTTGTKCALEQIKNDHAV
jgi:hypothetical protein